MGPYTERGWLQTFIAPAHGWSRSPTRWEPTSPTPWAASSSPSSRPRGWS